MSCNTKHRRIFHFILGFALVCAVLLGPVTALVGAVDGTIPQDLVVSFNEPDQSDRFVYLSDLDYLPSSRSGWGNILKDTTSASSKITLKQDGMNVTFDKGIWAHASSNVYYDLSEYQDYDYFTTFLGVNTTANSSGSVKFHIYTTTDTTLNSQTTWSESEAVDTSVMGVDSSAQFVQVDIKGAKYLRLYADSNGSNSNDHAVYADAKLVKQDYQQYLVPELKDFDQKIQSYYQTSGDNPEADAGYEVTLLRRNLIKNAGRYTLTAFARESAENRETLEWLYNNVDVLRRYTTGGKPSGSYLESLRVLSRLYHTHGDDLRNRYGDLYERMMITLSLTHSTEVRFWIRDKGEMAGNPDSPNVSDPIRRYEVYKRLYLENKLATTIFQTLEVEEMRYVMATELGDEEIAWLNDYMKLKYPSNWPTAYAYPPVPYVSIGNHYWYDSNYAEENQQQFIDKYHLNGDGYSIGFEKYAPHLWMIMYHGGVCWQISNTGQNMTASQGIPSTTFGQPGHVAYANYEVRNGTPVWALTNDVSGWTKTDYTGYTNTHTYHQVRQLNNWGASSGGYASRYQGSYIVMSQTALNDFDSYEKSQEQVLLANSYSEDLEQQETIYRQALTTQDINLDAWLGLVRNYLANDAKSEADYLDLAEEITDALELYPLPMYDLLRMIFPKVTSAGYNSALTMLQTRTLQSAAATPNTAHVQAGVTRLMANYLLGIIDNEVAKFSFDGDEAEYLKLGAKYESSSAAWEYSLDGGNTWSSGEQSDQWISEKSIKLSSEQINSITAENDIKVHIQGVPRIAENIYTIDITEQDAPNNLYANDLENRVIGVNTTMDWRYVTEEDGNRRAGEWISYRDASPDLSGEKVVQLRIGRTGTKLASDASVDYVFHTDPDDLGGKRHYIPISHLSIAGVSSQATSNNGHATHAIDGNMNSFWHSAWNGSDTAKWITFKFDHRVDLSALEYFQNGTNGRILEADLYASTSEDGAADSFKLVGKISSNCEGVTVPCQSPWPNTNNTEARTFEFGHTDENGDFIYEPVEDVKYLKVVGTRTGSASNLSFITARMFNFYEDIVSNPRPTAGVAYSTTEPISGAVVARLVNPSMDIEITSEGGDTHVFTANGEHIFKFHEKGNPNNDAEVIAKVDWITYDAPIGYIIYTCTDAEGVEYDCSDGNSRKKTNQSVHAELVFDEGVEVTITNHGEQGSDWGMGSTSEDTDSLNPFTHLFMDNGRHIFEYVDQAGNKGTAVASVDWIDKIAPVGIIEYSTLNPTTGKVTARLMNSDPDDQDFVVTNNGGSIEYEFDRNGEFTFEYRDEAGNTAATTAKVSWIQEKPTEQPDNKPNDSTNSGDVSDGTNSGETSRPGGNSNNSNSGSQNSSSNNTNNSQNNSRPIQVETSGLPSGSKTDTNKLELSNKLEEQFGSNSELYEIKFTDADGNILDKTPETATITIPSGKKLRAVYVVDADGNTKRVEYEQIDSTHIRIKNPTAGKYLFDYEDAEREDYLAPKGEEKEKSSTTDDTSSNKSSSKIWLWGGIAVVIILVFIVASRMADNRRR